MQTVTGHFGNHDFHNAHPSQEAWKDSFRASSVTETDISPTFSEQQQQSSESPSFNDTILFPSTTSSNPLPTPRSTGTDTKRHSPSSSNGDNPASPEHKIRKRQRNTEAARRYRQRKVDRVTELEEALQAMTRERDELRLKLARSEAEADVLRGMVGRK